MNDPTFNRDTARARMFLRCVLPLIKVVVEDRPQVGRRFSGTSAVLRFEAPGVEPGTQLVFENGSIRVEHGNHLEPTVTLQFKSARRLSEFFSGGASLPRIRGFWSHLPFAFRVLGLLRTLRILDPKAPARTPQDRALRVKLVLYLLAHGLSRMNTEGHPGMQAFAAKSPERVYQWSVRNANVGAYLRVHQGRTKSGRGTYSSRRPFVHFIFPTTEDAFQVFTTLTSQMEAVEKGRVLVEGSPEYSRKISILAQKMDALLTEGEG